MPLPVDHNKSPPNHPRGAGPVTGVPLHILLPMDMPPTSIAPTVIDPRGQTTISTSPSDAPPLGERYDILGELGTGGMGRAYRVRDRETGEVLALKVLRAEITAEPSMAERFKNELRLARRITHKNVCRIYDFNRVGSVAYISMEYVDGETLRARLDRGGALPPSRVVSLARQICAGLAEAHAQGVIHRDLKPENVMITTTGSVKLMDFGIARSLHANSTATQTLIGTPSYMAPHRPRADVPRALEMVVMRCLEKDPARRYASVDQAAQAFTGTNGGATAPSSERRRWPWVIAIAALLVVGAVWKERHGQLRSAAGSALPPARAVVSPAPPIRTGVGATNAAPEPHVVTRRDDSPAADGEPEQRAPAFQHLKEAAESGDPAAQFRLAQALFDEPTATRDESAAREWLQRSAEQGNKDAQFALGMMYEHGRGGARDIRAAVSRYERAAAGHAGAQRNLARLTERGPARLRAR